MCVLIYINMYVLTSYWTYIQKENRIYANSLLFIDISWKSS